MLGLSLSSWPGIWSFQHSTSAASSLWIWSCIPQAPSMSPIATHQACCHPFLVPSAPEHRIPTLTWHHRFVQRLEGHWSEHVRSEPVALRLPFWEGQLGSGLRYMICLTRSCTLRKSENTRTCENCTRSACNSCFACNSRMSVCFLTHATCKNVQHNLIPWVTA